VALVNDDIDVMRSVEPYADLFEVRIDLIGKTWPELAHHIRKPWIATNRMVSEGGKWTGSERARIYELLKAVDLAHL
jgi:3-dehydroquinate dehydratase